MQPHIRTGSRLLAGIALATTATLAQAQDFYIQGAVGINNQDDVSNNGTVSSAFTTGTVTGVNPPLDIPAGAPVNWNTGFDNGNNFGLALGMFWGAYRFDVEYSRSNADVDSHQGVNVAGLDLSGIDAGVLLAGNTSDLGQTVAELVADGRGEIETSTFMVNAYYDFDLGGALTPFAGIGIGSATTDITYNPSGVAVLDDDDTSFVYQLTVGASYAINDNLDLYGSYRYRDADEGSFDASLLPVSFDINNESGILDLGLRYRF